jgi:indoleamine 2,3-dioxygenase
MADAGLPNGVRYGDETEYRAISGGSNAQSSLIQALDILLDIEHHPTGERPNSDRFTKSAQGERSKNRNNFIYEMRTYMPGPHRRFLEALSQVSEIREFVMTNAEQTPALIISYDACLAMLRTFRDKHIQVVSRYIILQAREAERRKQPSLTKREGLAASKSSDQHGQSKPKRGTGGTALIPFLKQARDETGDPAASSWGKRLLSDNMAIIGKRNRHIFSSSSDEETPEDAANKAVRTNEGKLKIGLNGSWEVEEDTHKSIMHW